MLLAFIDACTAEPEAESSSSTIEPSMSFSLPHTVKNSSFLMLNSTLECSRSKRHALLVSLCGTALIVEILHSDRNATIGSTLLARNAGTRYASKALVKMAIDLFVTTRSMAILTSAMLAYLV